MQKHKCEEHRCDECDFVTYTAKLLHSHKLNKHMEKPLKCDFCDYRTNRRAELLNHIRHNHTMERPFKCDKCEMAFSSKNILVKHMVSAPFPLKLVPESWDFHISTTYPVKGVRCYLKTSTWKEYVFDFMTHLTYVILLSPHVKCCVLI